MTTAATQPRSKADERDMLRAATLIAKGENWRIPGPVLERLTVDPSGWFTGHRCDACEKVVARDRVYLRLDSVAFPHTQHYCIDCVEAAKA